MENNNINNDQPLSTKYQGLLDYRIHPSSVSLCISELIDNSIASYEKNCDVLPEAQRKLEIKIIWSKYGKFIRVYDNAFGMDAVTLKEALEPYNKSDQKDQTSKNQYGIGLKFAIFYLATNGKVYTKTNDNTGELVGSYKAKINNIYEELNENNKSAQVYPRVDKSNDNILGDYEHGTCVEISNFYPYKNLNGPTDRETIKEFLGIRFSSYLSGDNDKKIKMTIKIIELNNNGTFEEPEEVVHYNIFDKDAYEIKDEDINLIKEIVECNGNDYVPNIKVDEIRSTKKLVWVDEYKGEFGTYKFKTCILKQSKYEWSGLGIRHSNRLICHRPDKVKNNDLVSNYSWYQKTKDHRLWLYSEINLEDLPYNEGCQKIRPDGNKYRLIFTENDQDKMKLEEKFKSDIQRYSNDIIKNLFDKLREKKVITSKKFRNETNSIKIAMEENNSVFVGKDFEQDEQHPNKFFIDIGKHSENSSFYKMLEDEGIKRINVEIKDGNVGDDYPTLERNENESTTSIKNYTYTDTENSMLDFRNENEINFLFILVIFDILHPDKQIIDDIYQIIKMKIESNKA